jgi:hypothetical protein
MLAEDEFGCGDSFQAEAGGRFQDWDGVAAGVDKPARHTIGLEKGEGSVSCTTPAAYSAIGLAFIVGPPDALRQVFMGLWESATMAIVANCRHCHQRRYARSRSESLFSLTPALARAS